MTGFLFFSYIYIYIYIYILILTTITSLPQLTKTPQIITPVPSTLKVNAPDYIVDEQIKRMIKNVNHQNKHCTTPPSQQTYIKLFYRNQMHYNYKSDEKILKTLIHRNIHTATAQMLFFLQSSNVHTKVTSLL